jgi:6-phosphogluconolactonase
MPSSTAATLPRFVYVGAYTGPGKAEGISVYRLDAQHGGLSHAHTVTGVESPSFLALDPQQRFLYAANEAGSDGSVSAFAVDQETGGLRYVGHEPTQGQTPRNFNIDPTGTFLLAANQNSNTIVSFRIDPEQGRLTPTGQVTETPAPVCIIFGT